MEFYQVMIQTIQVVATPFSSYRMLESPKKAIFRVIIKNNLIKEPL